MKPKIYITRKIDDRVLKTLANTYDVTMWPEEDVVVPREVLLREVKHVDALFCLLTETIDEEVLDAALNLRVVSNMAVGFNNIDIEVATRKGIAVTNTPDVLTETTADLTFALLMATARRIVESETFLKDGKWQTWSPMLLTGQDIHGATLGIIGLGRIGESLVKRAKGFDMNVIYHSRTRKPVIEDKYNLAYTPLETLLEQSDFVVVLTPLTSATKNLISYGQFALMKKNAILINTSRGGIVNEEALYDALVEERIWGAGIDVFDQEPVSTEHPLLKLPNVVVTPHIGSASIQTRLDMAHLAVKNIQDVLDGQPNDCIVNREYDAYLD